MLTINSYLHMPSLLQVLYTFIRSWRADGHSDEEASKAEP